MDITYIPMAKGFVYLACVLDWPTRRVLSWRLSRFQKALDQLAPKHRSFDQKLVIEIIA